MCGQVSVHVCGSEQASVQVGGWGWRVSVSFRACRQVGAGMCVCVSLCACGGVHACVYKRQVGMCSYVHAGAHACVHAGMPACVWPHIRTYIHIPVSLALKNVENIWREMFGDPCPRTTEPIVCNT